VPFSDKVRLVFLQLPYFTKEVDDCETTFEKIIYVLKHMDVLKRMPWMAQEAVFQKLASIADVASLSKQERIVYDENLRRYRDTVAVMEGQWELGHAKGIEKGRKEGMEKGRKEGRKEGMEDVARKLKTKGFDLAVIMDATGLTEAQIAAL